MSYVCHVNENIEGAVYIGREYRKRGYDLDESPLRNMFVVGPDGTREQVIGDYRHLFTSKVVNGFFPEIIHSLIAARGKPLACWCRKSTAQKPACHGDVIHEMLDRYTDDELRAFIRDAVKEAA